MSKRKWDLKSAVEQIDSCKYHCQAGPLGGNDAFVWLKEEAALQIVCPFCQTGEYDLVGLKNHYERGWCDEYNETIDLPRRA